MKMADKQKSKTLAERLVETIDLYAAEKKFDHKLTLNAVEFAVSGLVERYEQFVAAAEREAERSAFQVEFDKRKSEFESECAQSGYPFKVARQWKLNGKGWVSVGSIRRSIFESEVK
jgi:hypothetical protein